MWGVMVAVHGVQQWGHVGHEDGDVWDAMVVACRAQWWRWMSVGRMGYIGHMGQKGGESFTCIIHE